jgi:hypothetical protein
MPELIDKLKKGHLIICRERIIEARKIKTAIIAMEQYPRGI